MSARAAGSDRSVAARVVAGALLALLAAGGARADVILSAGSLNTALKKLQRLQQEIAAAAAPRRAEALFELGVEADALATHLNDEVAAHGMQEKTLLDLALVRAGEVGVAIAWSADKQRFFYDGAAFATYLARSPKGPRAPEASFWAVENEFYKSSPDAPEALVAAAGHKKEFLARYPKFALAADVEVFLAIDYRDLYRHHQQAGDAAAAGRFRELARRQFKGVVTRFAGSEQARIAAEMLERFEKEVRTRETGG